MTRLLRSYVCGDWYTAPDDGTAVTDAATGEVVARVSSTGLDTAAMLEHARTVGGPGLRATSFHERAAVLKNLAAHLQGRREEFYPTSARTGATRSDSAVDVDGGIGTAFVYASLGRRELPAGHVYVEGGQEKLGKTGAFVGQHVLTPLHGVALQINAFNFPVWGMLEKLAPALLAGVPTIVKPASQTAYLTEQVVSAIVESGLLPEGALQLVCGGLGDTLDRLTGQDLVSLTGSAATANRLRSYPRLVEHSVRFNAEADSLNCSILGPDAAPGTAEFDLYVRQLVTEMTVKAGQKCTAIRRAFVPRALLDAVTEAAAAQLAQVRVGRPDHPETTMGPLASLDQREEVRRAIKALRRGTELVFGDPDSVEVVGADAEHGAFMSPVLLAAADPDVSEPHEIEAFGPVATLLPYDDAAHVVGLAARGEGSLAGSVVTADAVFARQVVLGLAPWHGRILLLDRTSAAESTGHGTPMPQLVHGGPGRAGGGEEEGGIRAVLHHMQRTALQASPQALQALLS